LAISPCSAHHKRKVVSAVKISIIIDGRGMGEIDADKRAVVVYYCRNFPFADIWPDQFQGEPVHNDVMVLYFRSGKGKRQYVKTVSRLNVANKQCGHISGKSIDHNTGGLHGVPP